MWTPFATAEALEVGRRARIAGPRSAMSTIAERYLGRASLLFIETAGDMTSSLKTLKKRLRRPLVPLLAALALLLLWAPGPASAEVSTHKLIWGPSDAKAFDTYADL